GELRVLGIRTWSFWPIVMILLGFMLVQGALRGPRAASLGNAAPGEDPTSTISAFAMWSGTGRKVTSQAFQGGDLTAVMGGHDIDLRTAKLAGGTAVLDLFVWWGGVELKVPSDWQVSCDALVMMGGI